MSQLKKTNLLVGFILTFCGAVLFSTKAIIVKKAFSDIQVDALSLLTLRMVFALPFYLFAAFWISRQKGENLSSRQWFYVAALGIFGYYISSFLDFTGLQFVSAGLERLILFLYPTFVVLINAMVFRQKINQRQKLALALTYLGIGIAYAGELQFDTANPDLYKGSLLIFLCAITYAIYIVGSGRVIPKIGATRFTAYAMLSATMGIFIHFMLADTIANPMNNNQIWIYGLLLAIIATVIPSFLISFGMKSIGSNNVAIISGIGPVATIIQAHFILGEPIFPAQIAGTVLVIFGVLLIGWKSNKEQG